MNDFQAYPKIARLNRDIVVTEKIDGTNAQVLVLDTNAPLPAGATLPGTWVNPIAIVESGTGARGVWAGSRNRWITPEKDNYGFARWVADNAAELVEILGPGRHFGEWWGAGVQRRYGLVTKRFSLFNVGRWGEQIAYRDPRCTVTPISATGGGDEVKHQYDRAGVKRCACCAAREALSAVVGGVPVASVPVLYRGPWFRLPLAAGDERWAPTWCLNTLRDNGSAAAPGFNNPEGIVVFHAASGSLFKATLEGDAKSKDAP